MFNFFKSKKDDSGSYKRPEVAIRLEAIGGQGAHSAGKIIAEAAVLKMGYTGQHFSSFGSEKRGTPVRSYVRFSTQRRPMRSASPVQSPDILAIFHENLMSSHPEILNGLHEHSIVIVNSEWAPEDIRLIGQVKMRRLVTLPATRIAQKNKCGINAVMLGACQKFINEIDQVCLIEVLEKFFSQKDESVQSRNTAGFIAGGKSVDEAQSTEIQSEDIKSLDVEMSLGWQNAPLGGLVVNPGNMALKDNSASRKGMAPRFLKDVCFHCGYCDMVCPDFCFIWKKTADNKMQLEGLDYQYCKGCQKCIEVCPVNALMLADENEIPVEERLVRFLNHKSKT
jgi:pyruvate ferredoxin oxidoreductase gamma subunit